MNGSLAIPEGLRRQFDELEQRLWRFDTIIAICGGIGSLLLSYALIFVSDRLWDTPAWMRVIFTGAGVAGMGCFIFGYGRRWIWGNRSFPALATLVQQRYRRLGDRLLGIVELADEQKRPANFSAALCKAAINQVATEAAKVDFREAVGTKRPRRYMAGVAVAALVAVTFCVVAPQAGWNALLRWLRPTLNVERYTFVSLDDVPDHLVIAHGEPFDLAVGLSAHSLLRPSQVSAKFEGQQAITAPVKSDRAFFHLPGQTQPVLLTLSAGDVKRQTRIQPEFRPELKQLTAHIELPAYLQYPPLDQKIDSGSLTFLEGSTVTIKGQTTRALSSANLEGKEKTPLKVEGDTFSTAPMNPATAVQIAFKWRDKFGLDAAASAKTRLQPKEDAAPQVECRGLAAAIAILEEEVIHVNVESDDDYGIKILGVRWQTASQKASETPGPVVDRKIGEGEPQSRSLKGRFDFSPVLLGIPADTSVAFYSTATDRYPNRRPSLSSVHQIYVLSRESHARLVQEQLEKLMAQLEELTRRQEALLDAGKNVREQSPQKLADQESGKKLADQSAEQKQTAEQLEKLAKQAAETLKEASKNKDFSPSALQEWAKHAQDMNDLAQQSMPNASKSLDDAKNDSGERGKKLDKALDQENDILKKMREMQKSTEASMEKLMTQNIAMRLRKIAGAEKSIVSDFQKILPDTIGMKAAQLPDTHKKTVEQMAGLHETSRGESNRLHGEISRLFERTKLDRYGDVTQEMENTNSDEALHKLTDVIHNNVTVQAMHDAAAWSKQYEAWADRLSEKDDSKSADSGQGQGQGSPPDMKALMALLQLREQEDTLRERTGAIDRQKNSNPRHADDAHAAATQQQEIQKGLQQLLDDPEFPIPPEDLAPAGKAMGDAKTLLDKPETGDPTTAAETDAINMLDAAILAQMKKSGKGAAAMMQMMGFGQGSSPGGNPSGGTTDKTNIHLAGSRSGAADASRHIIQSTGNTGTQLPAEFREAIENYQRAVEQEGRTP